LADATHKLLAGRNAFITGANTGIGRVTARELAKMGARVFIASRSLERTQPVLDEIRAAGGAVEWLPLDLGDFASVRACAANFLEKRLELHLLINNAGLAGTRGLSKSGFEVAFGVNHLGHFLLTQLLTDCLLNSTPARIVTVASRAHRLSSGIDWEGVTKPTRSATGVTEYANSKLANILFSAELARKLAGTGVTTYSLHPGVVASDIWRSVPQPFRWLIMLRTISTEKGAKTSLHCATSAEAGEETGLYYANCRVTEPTRRAQDVGLAAELWRRSEEWTGQK
jgi:retinol dehydrogenase 12